MVTINHPISTSLGADTSQGLETNVVMILIGAILVLVVMLVILVLLSRAMYQLRVGAKRLAEGKLYQRLEVSGPLNVAMVAESLNTMAALLEERLQTVVDQRNEFSAVVTNMAEGVLTFDH